MSEPSNNHFEKEWEMAFDDKELMPSESVWKEIELHIAKAENDSNKKRILFFQLLAAASVTFAMVVGTWQLYDNYYLNDATLVDVKSKNANDLNQGINRDNGNPSKTNDDREELVVEKDKVSISENSSADFKNEVKSSDVVKSNSTSSVNNKIGVAGIEQNDYSKLSNKSGYSSTNDFNNTTIAANNSNDDNNFIAVNEVNTTDDKNFIDSFGYDIGYSEPGEIELHMVPWLAYSNTSRKKKSDNANSLWTGLNMSAGVFNPNGFGESSSSLSDGASVWLDELSAAGSVQTLNIGSENIGSTYGVGINIGKQLNDKVVLLGGMNYVQQTTSNTSNLVLSGARTEVVSSLNEVRTDSKYETTEDYTINSTYETISLPVQAGYYVLDRKFNVLLIGGVANDFFIKRELRDESGLRQSSDLDYNDEGYSLYSVGGIIGTQFSYDIGDNYSVALQPQYKQMLNSFTPNGNKPSSIEVGFRFNYRIK